jgi:hypothetical protein
VSLVEARASRQPRDAAPAPTGAAEEGQGHAMTEGAEVTLLAIGSVLFGFAVIFGVAYVVVRFVGMVL